MSEEKVKEKAMSEEKVASLDEQSTIKLVSNDNESFIVNTNVACCSLLIKTILEGDPTAPEVPLPNVCAAILKKMLVFMQYHLDNPFGVIEKPVKSVNIYDVVSKWDADFIDVDQEVLFELIVASNWMDVKNLLELGCAKVATMLKDKTPEQIRKTFNIVNDFMPAEEEQIRAENKWAEDA